VSGAKKSSQPTVVNGWSLLAHPIFLDQLAQLVAEVETLRKAHPGTFQTKNATKRLAAIHKLMLEVIPADPAHRDFRQGGTLGAAHKHWFRARFFQQYRLFFRFHTGAKLIVYGWVNDEKSKREATPAAPSPD
jgi:toxin YhaV